MKYAIATSDQRMLDIEGACAEYSKFDGYVKELAKEISGGELVGEITAKGSRRSTHAIELSGLSKRPFSGYSMLTCPHDKYAPQEIILETRDAEELSRVMSRLYPTEVFNDFFEGRHQQIVPQVTISQSKRRTIGSLLTPWKDPVYSYSVKMKRTHQVYSSSPPDFDGEAVEYRIPSADTLKIRFCLKTAKAA